MDQAVTAKQVEQYTKRKLDRLLSRPGESAIKRALAELRRGVGKAPGEVPQLWGYFLQDMPEAFLGDREPSRAEWAVYTALTLFALHQQGKDPRREPMNREGQSLGNAVGQLVHGEEDQNRVARRFYTMATSAGMEELAHHMRAIVQLLRSKGIALDYPALAGDLYGYQFPTQVSRIRLKWGQDFYRNLPADS